MASACNSIRRGRPSLLAGRARLAPAAALSTPGRKGQIAAYNASTNAVVGIPAQCTPIETFGGGGNNSTVNDTPFDNLVAAFGTNGGCIGFAPGIYSFSSARTIKVVGVRLIDAESVKALFEPEKPCKQEHR
jgi:hypothetical protein